MLMSETELRRKGIRLTPQRHMILAAIAQGNGHMTAEEILQRIVPLYPDINISTVYRNLERLLALRLVAVTDLGGGRVCYETLERSRHHHLVCHKCGSMVELDDDAVADLRRHIARTYNFTADADHLALWGVCASCQGANKTVQEE
jgi:Fur family ferric uptake transcriptional regulator